MHTYEYLNGTLHYRLNHKEITEIEQEEEEKKKLVEKEEEDDGEEEEK